jgi:hypothetical protein
VESKTAVRASCSETPRLAGDLSQRAAAAAVERDRLIPKLGQVRLLQVRSPWHGADILLARSDCADQALRCPRKRGRSNDATRIAYVEVLEDDKATTAAGFLRRAVERDDRQRLLLPLTRARARLQDAQAQAHAHPPSGPAPTEKTNASSAPCSAAGPTALPTVTLTNDAAPFPAWLDFYKRRRPHGSLSHQPPLARLEALKRNNLAGS